MQAYRVYRANRDKTGCATQWELSYKENKEYNKYEMFLVGAKQKGELNENGNAVFDWKEGAIIVKLGENDLGELLAVLERRKTSAGYKGSLFHETPGGGNKVIELNKLDNGYQLRISAQDKDKKRSQIQQVLSDGEAAVLTVLLKRAIERFFDW